MRLRRSIARCPADDRARWRDAVERLTRRGSMFGAHRGHRLDDFVELYATSRTAFEGPARLPAMRVLLFHFETELRAGGAELPYWEFGHGLAGDPLELPPSIDAATLGRNQGAASWPAPCDLATIADYTELWPRLRAIEGAVAAAVGGVIASERAPADPAFWLVAAAMDRAWWTWARRLRKAHPYRSDQARPGSRMGDRLPFDERWSGWIGAPTPASVIDAHALSGEGVAYDTDDPEVAIEGSPLLSFGSMATGERRRRRLAVVVESARPVSLAIVERSPGPWRTPNGLVRHVPASDGAWTRRTCDVVLEAEAERLGVERGRVVLEATVDDDDPWFASGSARAVERIGVELAMDAIRPGRAWGIVIDRSSISRWLGDEAEVSAAIRGIADLAAGLVDRGDEVMVVESAPDDASTPELDRWVQTDVDRRALVLVDDGAAPTPAFADVRTARLMLEDPHADASRIGDDERVRWVPRSEGLLGALGGLAAELAEIRGVQTVHSGSGTLGWGSVHRFPLDVDALDERIEVEVLSGLAPLVDVRLFDPTGTRVEPESTSAGLQAVVVRHRLEGASLGRWACELALADEDHVRAWLRGGEVAIDHVARHRIEGGLPYRVTARVRSGLELRLEPARVRCRAGEILEVEARVTAHGLEVDGELTFAATLHGRPLEVEQRSNAVACIRAAASRVGSAEIVATVRGRTSEGHRVVRLAARPVVVLSTVDTSVAWSRIMARRDRALVEWLLQRVETGDIAAATVKRLEKLGVDVVGALQAFARAPQAGAEPTRRTSGLGAWVQQVGTSLLSVDPKVLFEAVRPARPVDDDDA